MALLSAGAACSAPGDDPFTGQTDLVDSQIDALGRIEITPAAAMPTTGTMRFDSLLYVLVDMDSSRANSPGDVQAVGAGQIVSDFGPAKSMTGSFDDFVGVAPSGNNVAVGGTIALDNGTIGAAKANGFEFTVAGRLTVEGGTYDVSDTVSGRFVGTPIQGFVGTGAGAPVLVDGSTARTGAVVVTATN